MVSLPGVEEFTRPERSYTKNLQMKKGSPLNIGLNLKRCPTQVVFLGFKMRRLSSLQHALFFIIGVSASYVAANAQGRVFSQSEVQQIEEIDPQAAVVLRADETMVEIENKTASIAFLENFQRNSHELYINSNLPKLLSDRGKAVIGRDAAYYDLALTSCSSYGRIPDRDAVVITGLYRKSYRCLSAQQWLENELKFQIYMCSKPYWEGILKSGDHAVGLKHFPESFVALFRKYVPIRDCNGVKTGLQMLNRDLQSSAQIVREKNAKAVIPDLERAKLTCAELGFNRGTEKFGECVLRLTK